MSSSVKLKKLLEEAVNLFHPHFERVILKSVSIA
jgi:hypothetical protein